MDKFSYIGNNLRVIGLNRVLDRGRSKPYRTLWALLIGFSVVFLCYHLYNRISYYTDTPVVADVVIKETRGGDFPWITVCQQIDFETLDKHLRSYLSRRQLAIYQAINDDKPARPKKTLRSLDNVTADEFDQLFRDLWPSRPPFSSAGDCLWISDVINRRFQTCRENWHFTRLTDLYRMRTKFGCWTLQHNWTAGIENFLRLRLPSKIRGTNVTVRYRLTIHGRNEHPELRENNVRLHALDLWKGATKWDIRFKETDLRMTRSRCRKDGLIYFKSPYSSLKCTLDKLMHNTLANPWCRCHVPWEEEQRRIIGPISGDDEDAGEIRICPANLWMYCFKAAWGKHFGANDEKTDEANGCISACDKKIFDVATSHYGTASGEQGLIRVYLQFASTHLLQITQRESFGPLRLLCEIGGALGLFLGIRILTLAELIDVSLVLFWRRSVDKQKHRGCDSSNNDNFSFGLVRNHKQPIKPAGIGVQIGEYQFENGHVIRAADAENALLSPSPRGDFTSLYGLSAVKV